MNRFDERGWSPLRYATYQNQEETAIQLIKHGARASGSEILNTLRYGRSELLLQLLRHGSVNDWTDPHDSPLHNAVAEANYSDVNFLLENGAKVSKDGHLLMGAVVRLRDERKVPYILGRLITRILLGDKHWVAGLCICTISIWKNVDLEKQLLRVLGVPEDTWENLTEQYMSINTVSAILGGKIGQRDVNHVDDTGVSALMVAAAAGSEDTVNWILDRGAEPNAADWAFYRSAFHYAALAGKKDIMDLLIQRRTEPSLLDKEKRTAQDYYDMQDLLRANREMNRQLEYDREGSVVLHYPPVMSMAERISVLVR